MPVHVTRPSHRKFDNPKLFLERVSEGLFRPIGGYDEHKLNTGRHKGPLAGTMLCVPAAVIDAQHPHAPRIPLLRPTNPEPSLTVRSSPN
jgi:hypothetical protein